MSAIKVSTTNNITKITLNRPEVRNAFNDAMISEMTQAFRDVSKDPQIRVIALEGSGESFSAGGDLNWMKSMVNFSKQENIADSEKLFEMYQALKDIPVPVVTKVHGHAMGGALGLIAASDIVFAERQTQFCFSEVRLGLAPAVISAFVKDKIHTRDMHRYFLTAEVFNSKEAYEMGLIHDYGDIEVVEDLINKTLKKISQNGPQAVRATKKLIADLKRTQNLKQTTSEVIAELRVSDEGQEGLSAFFEKRKPSWLK